MPKKIVQESFSVSLISGSEKFFAQEEYVMIFCRIFFVSQGQKKLVHEAFSVSLIPGVEKFHAKEGYIMMFCRIFFVSQFRKKSYRNLLVFH